MTSRLSLGIIALVIGIFGWSPLSLRADNQALRQDRLQPYVNGPPQLALSQDDVTSLDRGDAVLKTFDTASGKQTAIVFRVAAPAARIWSVITDFNAYPQWVKGVQETEVYKREQHDIYVRFRIAHWLLGRYTYYVRHTYPWKQQGWGTWQLDETQASDFKAAIGFWRVVPVAGDREQSDVIYSADIRFKANTPKWLRRLVVKRGLKQASGWVKQQAEDQAVQRIGAQTGKDYPGVIPTSLGGGAHGLAKSR